MTTEPRITAHLVPAFGERQLKMQEVIDRIGLHKSRSIVDHLRWDLNSIFKMAVSDGLVDFNPAMELFTGTCKPQAQMLVLTPEQIRGALKVLELRERLIFRLAVLEGIRPGEILPLQLRHLHETRMSIEQRVYEGQLDTPKGRRGRTLPGRSVCHRVRRWNWRCGKR